MSMRLGEFALRHRVTVFFVLAAVAILGGRAYRDLPRESFPDISIPIIIVMTPYPGASPTDVESQITDKLEKELKGIEALKQLSSTSQESFSVVTVEFVSGTDVDQALQKVRDRVDVAKVEFPTDAKEPALSEINFSDIPILQVNLAGDVGPAVLKKLAKDLQDEIEGIQGVLRVSIVGGLALGLMLESGTGALIACGAVYGILAWFAAQRRRWAWVALTLASFNPLVWLVNAFYFRKRWAECAPAATSG